MEIKLTGLLGRDGHCKVDPPILQRVQQGTGQIVLDPNLHLRPLAVETRENSRQEGRGDGRERADRHASTLAGKRLSKVGEGQVVFADQSLRDRLQFCARGGQGDVSGVSIEQSRAQLLLEQADRAAQGRLRDVLEPCCFAEAAGLRHAKEEAQRVEADIIPHLP